MSPPTIVILGAGFAGMAFATELAALLPETESPAQDGQERCEIVLIDRTNFSLFTPMLTRIVGSVRAVECLDGAHEKGWYA